MSRKTFLEYAYILAKTYIALVMAVMIMFVVAFTSAFACGGKPCPTPVTTQPPQETQPPVVTEVPPVVTSLPPVNTEVVTEVVTVPPVVETQSVTEAPQTTPDPPAPKHKPKNTPKATLPVTGDKSKNADTLRGWGAVGLLCALVFISSRLLRARG